MFWVGVGVRSKGGGGEPAMLKKNPKKPSKQFLDLGSYELLKQPAYEKRGRNNTLYSPFSSDWLSFSSFAMAHMMGTSTGTLLSALSYVGCLLYLSLPRQNTLYLHRQLVPWQEPILTYIAPFTWFIHTDLNSKIGRAHV